MIQAEVRDPRNLPKGGFGMAITKEKNLSFKVETDLYNAVHEYADKNEMDASKVARLALKNFLGYKSPAKSKEKRKAG
jgi:hypothetical protein